MLTLLVAGVLFFRPQGTSSGDKAIHLPRGASDPRFVGPNLVQCDGKMLPDGTMEELLFRFPSLKPFKEGLGDIDVSPDGRYVVGLWGPHAIMCDDTGRQVRDFGRAREVRFLPNGDIQLHGESSYWIDDPSGHLKFDLGKTEPDAFSPDGALAVFCRVKRQKGGNENVLSYEMAINNLKTGKQRKVELLKASQRFAYPGHPFTWVTLREWSPEGIIFEMLGDGAGYVLVVVDPKTGKLFKSNLPFEQVEWLKDGSLLYNDVEEEDFMTGDHIKVVHKVEGKKARILFTQHDSNGALTAGHEMGPAIDVARDGYRFIISGDGNKGTGLWLVDIRSGHIKLLMRGYPVRQAGDEEGGGVDETISPDGKWLLYSDYDKPGLYRLKRLPSRF